MPKLSELRQSQPHAAQVLAQGLSSGRLHHAYILVGSEERARLDVAQALALALVCSNRSEADACLTCAACRKLLGGNHPDVVVVEPEEKATIAIDKIRDAVQRLSLKAQESSTKVVLLHRADLMTVAAQNALLKTLEEPPGATVFLLTAPRIRALLPTIRSRCQTLRLVASDRLLAWQNLTTQGLDEETARLCGPLVGNDIDRAQELVALGIVDMSRSLASALASPNSVELIKLAADLGSEREKADLFLRICELHFRDALAAAQGVAPASLYTHEAALAGVTRQRLVQAATQLRELRRLAAYNPNRTLALENVLLLAAGKQEMSPT